MGSTGAALAGALGTLSRDEIVAGDVFICTDRILWVRLQADSFQEDDDHWIARPCQLIYFYGDGIWPVYAAERANAQGVDNCICDLAEIQPMMKIFTKADASMFPEPEFVPLPEGQNTVKVGEDGANITYDKLITGQPGTPTPHFEIKPDGSMTQYAPTDPRGNWHPTTPTSLLTGVAMRERRQMEGCPAQLLELPSQTSLCMTCGDVTVEAKDIYPLYCNDCIDRNVRPPSVHKTWTKLLERATRGV